MERWDKIAAVRKMQDYMEDNLHSRRSGPVQIFMPERIRDYYLTLQKGDVKMTENEKTGTVFVQVVERPRRKLILKRGFKASHYFDYCEEVGCDVWEILSGIKEAMYEPAGMWLPANLAKPGTSTYVMGVEVALTLAARLFI